MTLAERLQEQPFQGYAYSYPHKMAYRPLHPARPLAPLWAGEERDALFLYVHLPFCEMRCGFCNLFTTTNPAQDQVAQYLAALARQMEVMGDLLGPHRFARAAFGGGTPTFLAAREIARLFELLERHLGGLPEGVPVSFEMSPATVGAEKMQVLRECGVTRASIGVQSFEPAELKALGRPQDLREVARALDFMRAAGFPVINVDLIYGAPGQTAASWERSLREALRWAPEELFLYPLYVRPLTGLERLGRAPSDARLELYRCGRELLLAAGYEQISMRLFRRAGLQAEPGEGPFYCCQEDGMVGLGAGARSYTREVHYSTEYAVGRSGVQEIIHDFSRRSAAQFAEADYGCELDVPEQRRRYVIKSLLRSAGLDEARYESVFQSRLRDDFPELCELEERGFTHEEDGLVTLTAAGMERSDTIGPALFSAPVQQRMEEYHLV